MKKYFLLAVSLILTVRLSAQSAQDYLNSIIETTKSYNDISIVFNYKMINEAAGINEVMSGHGSMKGDSYLINVSGQEMISNGKLVWTHLIEDEEVMISEVTEGSNASPISIINSFSENIKVNFINSNDPNVKTVEVRENVSETFDKIQISVNSKDLSIKKVHAFSTDGNEFIYEITSFTTNQNLPDSMFIFNEALHPNVEVIDMR